MCPPALRWPSVPRAATDPNGFTTAQIGSLLAGSTFANGANIGIDTTYGNFTYANDITNVGLGLVVLGTPIRSR